MGSEVKSFFFRLALLVLCLGQLILSSRISGFAASDHERVVNKHSRVADDHAPTIFPNEAMISPAKNAGINTGRNFSDKRPIREIEGNAVASETTNLQSSRFHWTSLHSLFTCCPRGEVITLTVDNRGRLFAGGSGHLVLMWTGTVWSYVGGAVLGSVYALTFDDNDNLYVGGHFYAVGGIAANNITKWDGDNWWALGSGLDGSVHDLVVDREGNLYAGGNFINAGGKPANNIGKWDGTVWSPLEDGLDGSVRALTFDKAGNLFAGGDFTNAGGEPANNIAMWDGTDWSPLENGLDGSVHALAIDSEENLYAGGKFLRAGGLSVNNIARWDGSSWSALGSGMEKGSYLEASRVNTLVFDSDDNLYAGGFFTFAGGASSNHVAMWDKIRWSAMGSGIGGSVSPKSGITLFPFVNSLAVDHDGVIYAGGAFKTAGDIPSGNIARWINLPYAVFVPSVTKQINPESPTQVE